MGEAETKHFCPLLWSRGIRCPDCSGWIAANLLKCSSTKRRCQRRTSPVGLGSDAIRGFPAPPEEEGLGTAHAFLIAVATTSDKSELIPRTAAAMSLSVRVHAATFKANLELPINSHVLDYRRMARVTVQHMSSPAN